MTLGKLGYVVATAIQALSTFAFLALATRILGPAQYGHWALIEPLLLIGGQVAMIGLSHGVIKLIAQDGRGTQEVLDSIGRIGLLASIAVAIVVAALVGYFLDLGAYSIILCLIFVAEGKFNLLMSTYRGAGQTTHYTVLVSCRALVSIALMTLILNSPLRTRVNANDMMYVWLLAIAAALCLHVFFNKSSNKKPAGLKSKLDLPGYKHAITYGAPILTASVLSAVLANADRYVLTSNVAAQAVTQYVVAGKAAAVLNLCITPLNLWWPTARFQHLNDKDAGHAFFSNAALIVCSGLTMVTAAIFSFSPEILTVLAPNAEFDPLVSGLLCLAALSIAMSAPLNVGGLKQGRTHWLTISVLVAASAQIVLAFALIPRFALPGAAAATMLSSFLSLAFQNMMSQRIHPVPFQYVAMAGIVFVWLLACVLIVQTTSSFGIRVLILIACFGLNLAILRGSPAWPLISQSFRR